VQVIARSVQIMDRKDGPSPQATSDHADIPF
jgi:hypothetical protein